MTRLAFVGVLTVWALLLGQSALSQAIDDGEQSPRIRWDLVEVFADVFDAPGVRRARELGVTPIYNVRRYSPQIEAGAIVRADTFMVEEQSNNVMAQGNVSVQVWADGRVVSSLTADQVTIREPGQ